MKPRLLIEQKITAFTNIYKIFSSDSEGNKSKLVAMAQQKRLAFKEKVSFYTDEEKSKLSFTFRAEKVFDIHGRYIIEDDNGQCVGMFKKDFKKSLLSSTWTIMDSDGNNLFGVKESNMVLALIRRFGGWIPILGDLIDIIVLFFRYHFVFFDIKTDEGVGQYKKTTLFRDHYALSVTDEAYAKSDWRVFAAMGVGLDALQSR